MINIRKNLTASGRLIIDLQVPNINEMVSSNGETYISEYVNPKTINIIKCQFTPRFEFENQIEYDHIVLEEYKGKELVRAQTAEVQMSFIFLRELLLLLEYCGHAILNVWKNYKRQPFSSDARLIIVEAQKSKYARLF